MKNFPINTTKIEKLEKVLINLFPGQNIFITFKTAEFIRDSNLYTGKKFRNLMEWRNEIEFCINENLYTLIWPDSGQIFIQGGSSL